MSKSDKFDYRENDIEVRSSYCDFCTHAIPGKSEKCEAYPDGKPESILNVTEICKLFIDADPVQIPR